MKAYKSIALPKKQYYYGWENLKVGIPVFVLLKASCYIPAQDQGALEEII